ncbi:MAG: tRNA (guanine-N(7)-)-methyltransferase [Chitinophagales bacterium]|nr:MAG: tRNA (guanine-N(7)-)-methyltransferase [Chitinophagales bacterium]
MPQQIPCAFINPVSAMSKSKMVKFAELKTFPNVLRNTDFKNPILVDYRQQPRNLRGVWSREFFQNPHPIVLELACGKGDYTLALARLYPNKNIIGIDLKGNRLWSGAKKALQLQLHNAAFIRSRIELLPHFFGENEVSEIWITFPDPYPKASKANKRLTSEFFIEKYRAFCKKGALVHLKTDDPDLFEFSVRVASRLGTVEQVMENVYATEQVPEVLRIQTYYERMHLQQGRTIRYLRFAL